MRHRHGLRKLNRTSAHRLAMLRNMTVSLLRHEAIQTTLPKAKELRRVAEPIINLGKTPSLSNRRLAFNRLRDLADRLKNRESFSDLVIPVKIGNETRWWELSASPRIDETGIYLGFRGVGSDITEQQKSADKINRVSWSTSEIISCWKRLKSCWAVAASVALLALIAAR